MAIRLTSSAADQYLTFNLVGSAAVTSTFMGWFRLTSDTTVWQNIFFFTVVGGSQYLCCAQVEGSGLHLWGINAETSGPIVLTVGTWYHIAVIYDSTVPEARLHLNGSLVLTEAAQAAANYTAAQVGAWAGGGDWFNGRVAGLKAWTAALTVPEIQQEMLALRPVRTTNLIRFVPAVGGTLANAVVDLSGNANLTYGGTPTIEDGPPIGWGATPYVYASPSVAGRVIGPGQIWPTVTLLGSAWR